MVPVGEIASLGAAVCWAIGLTLFRRDVRAIGARAVNLFKGIVGTLLYLGCMFFVAFQPVPLDAQLYLALSGIVGLSLGDTLLFVALGELGAHRTALLAILGPVFTAIGGWMLLGEALGGVQMAGMALSLGGLALVVGFRGDADRGRASLKGTLFALMAALCQAAGVLLAKRGLQDAGIFVSTALRLSAATAVLALFALFVRRDLGFSLRRLMAPPVVRRLVVATFFGTFLGLLLMQTGIAYTRSAIANALHSTTPLFTLPIALFVLRERIRWPAIAGSFVAVAGVVLLLASF